MASLSGLLTNRILGVAAVAWAAAQILKVVLIAIFSRKFEPSRFIGAGGMPSSHSALVVSLSLSVGFQVGFASALFALSAVFSLVVMYDAAGVRRAAGNQAKLLNAMAKQLFVEGKLPEPDTLRELLGHTPIEVLAGAALGAAVAFLFRNRVH